MIRMSVEILAPVGGKEQLIAAVRSGADAVYLGTQAFNARRNAENFDENTLKEAVEYCHGRGVKVHVTVNTLVKDAELPSVYDQIEVLAQSGVDAVLVQDMAVARLFVRHCPDMPLHASTQMTIHNLEGVLAAQALGFSRVVLARELSIEEIRRICAGSNIEIEAFVHGALCMCLSGQCYLSSMLGERSGNRGLCAQPCRLDFNHAGRGHTLSLKDMSHIAHIRALMDAGVCSLKIEGRMKRPEYVAAAVLACREAVDGKTPDLTNLKAVFSRSGFTDGFLTGKRDLAMFGHRTKEDAAAAGAVLGGIASGYRNELSRIPVAMHLSIAQNQPAKLTVSDGTFTAAVQGDIPEKARVKGTDEQLAFGSLSKTGGTPFMLQKLTVNLDETLMLPQSKLNAMRKQALDDLLAQRGRIVPKPVTGQFTQPEAAVRNPVAGLRVRLENQSQLFDGVDQAERIYLPLSEIDEPMMARFGSRLIGELPRLTFPLLEPALEKRLEALKALGLGRVCVGNIGAVRVARRMGFAVHGGFDLNILNSESLAQYEALGLEDTLLSCEINLQDAAALGGEKPRGIIGYGYLPLMIFRNCPARGARGCGNCDGRPQITDRTGARMAITCSGRQYSSLHNALPLYLGDKDVHGMDYLTLYFTVEQRAECEAVWQRYTGKQPYDGKFTRGLYYRRLL